MTTNKLTTYVISLDADDLSDGSPWAQVQFDDPGAGAIGSAVAVLFGARYKSDTTVTAIA